jgi:hypothetical protein
MARFQVVTIIAVATSAAAPAALVFAVWNRVAAPPKARPQIAAET